MRHTLLVPLALLLVAPLAARAQRVVSSIEVGGASMRYADSVNATAATVSPALLLRWPRAGLAASASFSQFTSGGWSTQGALAASGFTRAAGPFLGELAGAAGGSAHEDGTHTGQLLGTARAHVMASAGGAWVGGGLGRMSDGAVWRAVRLAEAGAWARFSSATVFASFSPTVVDDTIRYSDAQLALRAEGDRLDFTASAGTRSGAHLPELGGAARSWGSASLTAWLGPRVALAASAGTYPVDLTQGFPGGRFVSLAVRFGARARGGDALRDADVRAAGRIAEELERTSRSGVRDFRVEIASDGRRMLRVRAPDANAVEIAGDFAAWVPVRLTSSGGGWWSATFALAPGAYQMNVRVNGGPWLVPPGLTALADEFGGAVGVLVVEGR